MSSDILGAGSLWLTCWCRYERMKGLAAVHVRKRPRISGKSRALRDSEGETKARRTKRCSTKSVGKLALFKELPLDIVYEVRPSHSVPQYIAYTHVFVLIDLLASASYRSLTAISRQQGLPRHI